MRGLSRRRDVYTGVDERKEHSVFHDRFSDRTIAI
jgi:hypothetical protein